MAACYPMIRPIAQGKSGHVYLAAFYRKECPLVPLSMLHTSRAKPVVNIWPLTVFGGGGTVGHRLQQRFFCNFMQQQCLFFVFFSFWVCVVPHRFPCQSQLSFQCRRLQWEYFNFILSQWKHDLSALELCLCMMAIRKKYIHIGTFCVAYTAVVMWHHTSWITRAQRHAVYHTRVLWSTSLSSESQTDMHKSHGFNAFFSAGKRPVLSVTNWFYNTRDNRNRQQLIKPVY